MYKCNRRTIFSHPVTVWGYKIDNIFKTSFFLDVVNECFKQCFQTKCKGRTTAITMFPKISCSSHDI